MCWFDSSRGHKAVRKLAFSDRFSFGLVAVEEFERKIIVLPPKTTTATNFF
jgi:hypothetical protein